MKAKSESRCSLLSGNIDSQRMTSLSMKGKVFIFGRYCLNIKETNRIQVRGLKSFRK